MVLVWSITRYSALPNYSDLRNSHPMCKFEVLFWINIQRNSPSVVYHFKGNLLDLQMRHSFFLDYFYFEREMVSKPGCTHRLGLRQLCSFNCINRSVARILTEIVVLITIWPYYDFLTSFVDQTMIRAPVNIRTYWHFFWQLSPV